MLPDPLHAGLMTYHEFHELMISNPLETPCVQD